MPEQFDLFKKPLPEVKDPPSGSPPPEEDDESFYPSKEDEEFVIGEFEGGGKKVKLIDPRKEKRAYDAAREEFKRAMEKLSGKKGTQIDLSLGDKK